MACKNDDECVGVYEEYCDEGGPFLKVIRGFMTSTYSPNCIFKKNTYKGKLLIYNSATEIKSLNS